MVLKLFVIIAIMLIGNFLAYFKLKFVFKVSSKNLVITLIIANILFVLLIFIAILEQLLK